MIYDAYLTIPLQSSHIQTRFCQTKRNMSCQCCAKIICLLSVIARFLVASRMWKLLHCLPFTLSPDGGAEIIRLIISSMSQQRNSHSIFDLIKLIKGCPNSHMLLYYFGDIHVFSLYNFLTIKYPTNGPVCLS